jgi:hypothetical protein
VKSILSIFHIMWKVKKCTFDVLKISNTGSVLSKLTTKLLKQKGIKQFNTICINQMKSLEIFKYFFHKIFETVINAGIQLHTQIF